MDLPGILSRVAANETTLTDYEDLRTILVHRGKKAAVAKASFVILTNSALCRQQLPPSLRRQLAHELTKDLPK